MKFHGIQLQEGSSVKNMTVDSGSTFPDEPNNGELLTPQMFRDCPDFEVVYEIRT